MDEGALKDPKSAYYGQFRKASKEVSLMFETANTIVARTSEMPASADRSTGMIVEIAQVLWSELVGGTQLSRLEASKFPESTQGSSTNVTADGKSFVSPTNAMGGVLDPNIIPDVQKLKLSVNSTNCTPFNKKPVEDLYGSENKKLLDVAIDAFEEICFAQALGIPVGTYRPSAVSNTIRKLQQELFVVGVLFLPLVGGLLGSIVFTIHSLLNDQLSEQMSPGYLFVRVIVGGAFGVIIGWFAATSSSSSEVVQRISGTPFTLAVIAGFSIESLSKVLLKYSRTASQSSRP
jgi:hypothetical protein